MAAISANLLTICFVMVLSVLSKNKHVKEYLAKWLEKGILKYQHGNVEQVPQSLSSDIEKSHFSALCKLDKYERKALSLNHMFRKRVLHELSKHHQKQIINIQQLDKFNKIDNAIIANNGSAVKTLLRSFLQKEGLPITADDIIKNNSCETSFSAINETLTHLVRDYNNDYYSNESLPMVEYILRTISQHVKVADDEHTDILVPGSGLGRVAHEVALNLPKAAVTSIEYSDLMHIGNLLIYSCDETIALSPWALDYSNHLSLKSQLKSFTINCQQFTKPDNLNIEYGDFRKFKINKQKTKKKALILITVFFMDTAENILEYLDTIESYKRDYETIHWVNLGPLKYGTRPKVVLTVEEFNQLRASRGWKDIQYSCSPAEEIGYITNNEGLYKGRYSLLKFHSIL